LKAKLQEHRQRWYCLHLLVLQSTQAPTRSKQWLRLCGPEVRSEPDWMRGT